MLYWATQFLLQLILLLSIASIRRKLLKTTYTIERSVHTNSERNWVFATNFDFIFTISLKPYVADLRYFKLWILLDQIIWVRNIKGLQHPVLNILRVKYLILFRRLNSFAIYNSDRKKINLILSKSFRY